MSLRAAYIIDAVREFWTDNDGKCDQPGPADELTTKAQVMLLLLTSRLLFITLVHSCWVGLLLLLPLNIIVGPVPKIVALPEWLTIRVSSVSLLTSLQLPSRL